MALPRYALITTLALATALVGCGDDDPPIEGGGDNDAGMDAGGSDGSADAAPDPEDEIDAGEPAELPELDSTECTEADAAPFTPYEEAGGNADSPGCWSQQSPDEEGNCAGFFCNWSENQVLCQMERPAGACNTEADLELGCDASIQDAVAECAREVQIQILAGQLDESESEAETKKCAREELPEVISPSCLTCYTDSAVCARDNCLNECLTGDSRGCDRCREEAGCTPDFFTCTGFPDPQQLNPDGSSR